MAPQPDAGPFVGSPRMWMRANKPRMGIRNDPAGGGAYRHVLDQLDIGGGRGLSNAQTNWMRTNLLGMNKGGENRAFRRKLTNYSQQSGGRDAFQQMLANMPGFQNKAPAPGMPNHLNNLGPQLPTRRRQSDGAGRPIDRPQPGPGDRRLASDAGAGRMFPQQARAFAGQSPMGAQTQAQPQQPPKAGVGEKGQQAEREAMKRRQETAKKLQEPGFRAASRHYGTTDVNEQATKEGEYWRGKGLDMTPEFESAMRDISNQYLDALLEVGYAEQDAAAILEMTKERLARKYAQDTAVTNEAAAEAGIFNSGVRQTNQDLLTTDVGYQTEDMAFDHARLLRDLALQRSGIENWRDEAIAQAWMDRARQTAGSY